MALWRKQNPQKVNAQKRSWRSRNVEHARALNLANQKKNRASANVRNRRWRAAHLEQANANSARWAKANPGKRNARAARYRSAQLRATPKWADRLEIQKVYDLAARFRSLGCDFHVDHVIPLQGKNVCGLHVHNNLEIIEARTNRSKSNQLHS